jgi:hypothetical protein
MKASVERRLAALAAAFERCARDRQEREQSDAFWERMRDLGIRFGIPELIPYHLDPRRSGPPGGDDRPPPRTAQERVKRLIEQAEAYIKQHQRPPADGTDNGGGPGAPPEPPRPPDRP